MSSVNGTLTAAVLSPGGLFISGNKRNKEVDINHFFHGSLARAHLGVLKATAQQHGIRLVGERAPFFNVDKRRGSMQPLRTTRQQGFILRR